MAYCGRTGSLSATGGLSGNVFNATITLDSNQTDTTVFGSGEFGDKTNCQSSGTLEFDTYAYMGDVDSMTGFVYNSAGTVFTGDCVGKAFNVDVDAKGLVVFKYTLKLTGDLT